MTRSIFRRPAGATVLLAGLLAGCAVAPQLVTTPAAERGVAARAAETITAEDMARRIGALAADSMRGRDTPSPELEKAARYLTEEFRRLGMQPAGDEGTFIQRFPVGRARPGAQASAGQGAPNVVALLPGADPLLRDTYVVLTAHFDHVGVGAPDARGDSIYNGADDNASGTAALVEVAEAFAALPERPARSVLFLAVSGEEKGLLGSMHFARNPTVPAEGIVANLNMDMISRNAPDTLIAIGQEYSTFEDILAEVLAAHPEVGLTVIRDPVPHEQLFFRSDQLSFIQIGVPALFFFTGLHEDYHRPSDLPTRVDPDKAARVGRLAFLVAHRVANDPVPPQWTPDGRVQVERILRGGR
jgi:hypothetical protein